MPKSTDPDRLSRELRRAVNKLMPVLHAYSDGKWAPDAEDMRVVALLVHALDEIARADR